MYFLLNCAIIYKNIKAISVNIIDWRRIIVNKNFKRTVAAVCGMLMLSGTALARPVTDPAEKEKYHNFENYSWTMVKGYEVHKDEATGAITFKSEIDFEGEKPANENLMFLIDDETGVSVKEYFSPDLDAFTDGSQPWIKIYIDNGVLKDYEDKKTNTVHIAYIDETAASVSSFPSPETRAAINRLKELEIMVGDENGDFEPIRLLTRAELAKIAVKLTADDSAVTDETEAPFTDVSKEDWAYPYVAAANKLGIMKGNADGTFSPDSVADTNEIIKVMMSLTGYDRFAELNGGYPDGYIKAAERYGLIKDGSAAYADVTRETAARLINTTLDLPLMKQSSDDEELFVIMDGKSKEFPLETISAVKFGGR